MSGTDFSSWMAAIQDRTETALAQLLPDAHIAPQRLHDAMRYAVLGGGLLFLATHGVYAAMFGLAARNVVATLVALALVWVVPFVAALTAVSADANLPMWIHYYAQATPLSVPPADAFGVVRGFAFLAVCGALTAFISQRVAGRRT